MHKYAHSFRDLNRNNLPQQEDVNPRTLRLNKLVQSIEPQLLTYYLDKLSQFLGSSKKELWLPGITPSLDAFLVRVICDLQNLEDLLDVIDERSKVFAREILQILHNNAAVFRLVHCYESKNAVFDILVYKKVFLSQADKSIIVHEQLVRSMDQSAVEPQQVDKQQEERQAHITIRFKLHWLNAMLTFIKDDTQTNLESPELSLDEADFVCSLTRSETLPCSFKALCSPLATALSLCSAVKELKVSFLYVKSDRIRVSVDKMPLNNNNPSPTKRIEHSASDMPKPPIFDSDSTLSKSQRAIRNRKKLIDSLESYFVENSLQLILNFICNEEEASIVFRNASEVQCIFLQGACNMAKTKRVHVLFHENVRVILRKIAAQLASVRNFEMKLDVLVKIEKNDKIRTVSWSKVPKESSKNGASGCKDWRSESAQIRASFKQSYTKSTDSECSADSKDLGSKSATKPSDVKPSASDERKPASKGKGGKPETPSTLKSTDSNSTTDTIKEKPTATVVKSANTAPKADSIDNEASASTSVVKTKDNATKTEQIGGKMGNREIKLLEDMSTPVESDIAMRMMRQMGYEGGPLGIRGEGIVEPIIPTIKLAYKAGLGCPQPEKKKSCSGFRLKLLQEIAALLDGEGAKREVRYICAMTKKEIGLVSNVVQTFSNRNQVHVSDDNAKMLVNKIMKLLRDTPEVILSYDVSNDKKLLTLSKHTVQVKTDTRKEPLSQTVQSKLAKLSKSLKQTRTITLELIISVGKSLYPDETNEKKVRDAGFNIVILRKILDFMKGPLDSFEMRFSHNHSKRNRMFVKDAVKKINYRRLDFKSAIENELASDVLTVVRNYTLEVIINSNSSFLFLKSKKDEICANNTDSDNNNTITKAATKNVDSNMPKVEVEITKNKSLETVIIGDDDKASVVNDNGTDPKENNDDAKAMSSGTTSPDTNDGSDAAPDPKDVSLNDDSFDLDDDTEKIDDNDNETSLEVDCATSDMSSKRTRADSANSGKIHKKSKLQCYLRYFSLTQANDKELFRDTIIYFQSALSTQLEDKSKVPLLECHGIQNGRLVYSCHNETARAVLISVAREAGLIVSDVTSAFKEARRHKMKMKINSFVGVNLKKLFSRIEFFNVGLSTDFWIVLDVKSYSECVVVFTEIDEVSYEYICQADFALFAGIDKVRFTCTWE